MYPPMAWGPVNNAIIGIHPLVYNHMQLEAEHQSDQQLVLVKEHTVPVKCSAHHCSIFTPASIQGLFMVYHASKSHA